jgi:hypothetical protein
MLAFAYFYSAQFSNSESVCNFEYYSSHEMGSLRKAEEAFFAVTSDNYRLLYFFEGIA